MATLKIYPFSLFRTNPALRAASDYRRRLSETTQERATELLCPLVDLLGAYFVT
jgi:hypothetical protein